ncbi:ATP-binding protein [Acinetobacter sp. BMW17]|uniref:ATP-binding protein n=1 Tax=Acinetobacter sp. BMW17 TaxID=1795629 RepID=UPI00078644AB|nr:ATP-binding protein [Acinetobacter sp. BMW17]
MKKIIETDLDHHKISLYPIENLNSNKNSFTIIIGSNNSGKSRLLNKIIMLASKEDYNFSKIIGFSSAHFNKLPTPWKIHKNYIKFSTNPADFVFGQDKYHKDLDKYKKIIENYIEKNEIDFSIKSNISSLHIFQLFEIFITSNKNQEMKANDWNIISKFLNLPDSIEFKITKSSHFKKLKKYLEENKNGSELKIDKLCKEDNFIISIENIFSLKKETIELLQLKLLSITKISYPHENKKLPLTSLSSGQLSILTLGLALISSIENGSLVCIDEPELNLHPEWQTEIIKLIEILSNRYTDCQFFIATHSPQIISNINSENSFVLKLNSKELKSSKEIINRSADFQLTEVFSAPGNNNEYLLRKILIILNKLNTNVALNEDEIHTKELIKKLYYEEKFQEKDKVKSLVEVLLDLEAE